MFLLSNSNRGPNVFDVFEHENRVLRCVLELLKKQKRLLIVAQAPFYAITWGRPCVTGGEILEARSYVLGGP